MNLRVNGEDRTLPDGTTVGEVVSALTDTGRGVAVALDGEVVPRSAWGETRLCDGQVVEVLRAVQGG